MSNLQSSSQPANPPLHWPSLVQLVLSLLAAFFLLGAAAIFGISAFFQYFSAKAGLTDLVQPLMVAASLVFAGVLVLPSAWFSWSNIAYPGREPTTRPERRGFIWIFTIVVLVLEAGVLLLGNWVSQNTQVAWFALPVLNVLASGLPALWVIYIGTRGLIPGLARRRWGVFAGGLVLGPLAILVLELVLLALMGILALLWIMLNPSLANQMYGLAITLQNSGTNLDGVIRKLGPFISNPGIIFLVLAFFSVLVPLLEEALKPIGVWFLAGQKLTPVQGFAYGILSGAGFGLFENLGNTSGGVTDWALLASARISTLLLHCFTAGLVGWALASAWSERRYLRLAVTYGVAVVLHGLWNGMVVLSAAAALQTGYDITLPAGLQLAGTISAVGLIALGVLVFLFYIGASIFFQRQAAARTATAASLLPTPQLPEAELPASPAAMTGTSEPGASVETQSNPGNDPTQPGPETPSSRDDGTSFTNTGKSE